MATDDFDLNTKTEKPKKEKKKKEKSSRKLPIKKILIFLFIICLLGGGAGSAWFVLFAKKPGKIEKSSLPKEIIVFAYDFLPEIHSGMVSLNAEILLTEKEINRIEGIEKDFPDQKKITDSEKKIWTGNLSQLTKFLVKLEKEIQTFYVSYRVNQETGKALIENRKDELKQSIDGVLAPSKELTDKLRALDEAKSFLDKTLDKISK